MSVPWPRRLADWWIDDPLNPGRATLDNPAVRQLAAAIAPGSRFSDLGGTMSLNVHLDPAGLVLRVHQPFVSRRRLLALHEVRRGLARQGLTVPLPVSHGGAALFRCNDRWAELETYLPHQKPAPTLASYAWLFGALGRLHHALAALDLAVPRPLAATYAPPGSLRRWLRLTAATVQGSAEGAGASAAGVGGSAAGVGGSAGAINDTAEAVDDSAEAVRDNAEAREIVRRTAALIAHLRTRWVPAARLPAQLIQGDARLGNLCRGQGGDTVYLDFGFLARRPRVHDLAYSLAFMILALDGVKHPGRFAWESVPPLIAEYEVNAGAPLTALERSALPAYTAAVPLYFMALAGFSPDPVRQLRSYLPFLGLSEWLLAHPRAGPEPVCESACEVALRRA